MNRTLGEQNLPQYLKLKEFVELSGLSESTVRRRARDGTLPVVQIGGKHKKLLFPADALERANNAISSTTSDDMVVPSSTTSSTGMPAETPSGPRPRWARCLPRHPK